MTCLCKLRHNSGHILFDKSDLTVQWPAVEKQKENIIFYIFIHKVPGFVFSCTACDNLFIYQARQSLARSQQGFWQPSFCRKLNLGSLCFDWGNRVLLLINASLKERASTMKLKGWKMDSFLVFFFSILAMKIKFSLVLLLKQSLHKLSFLQKLGCQKPCWDQARLCLAW